MVHALDATESEDRPWIAGSVRADILSDRMSVSLIFQAKGTNAFGGGGVVLNPEHTRVFCFYGGDGGTRGKLCRPPGETPTCIPGCQQSAGERWCDASRATNAWCDGRPWHFEDMGVALQLDALKSEYNEAVVDAFYWNAQLPHSIDALIATPNDPRAEAMHRTFLSTYHLTADAVPLVVFNKARGDCPFELYGGGVADNPNVRLGYRCVGMACDEPSMVASVAAPSCG